jgi:hypothetical protein
MYPWSPNGVQTRRGCVRGSYGNHVLVDAPHAKPLWLCAMVPMVAIGTNFMLSRDSRDNIVFSIYGYHPALIHTYLFRSATLGIIRVSNAEAWGL